MFTAIQFACLVCLWLIKTFSQTSILFPLMLIVMIGIRKSLDTVFTRRELKILDDIMPEMSKKAAAEDTHQLDGDGAAHGGVEVNNFGKRLLSFCLGPKQEHKIGH